MTSPFWFPEVFSQSSVSIQVGTFDNSVLLCPCFSNRSSRMLLSCSLLTMDALLRSYFVKTSNTLLLSSAIMLCLQLLQFDLQGPFNSSISQLHRKLRPGHFQPIIQLMSLQFKENLCPNVMTTEPDEQGMLQSLKAIKRTYSQSAYRLQTSTTHSKSIKQLNPVLSSLFKSITQKHERNRTQMNDLIKQFTQRYEQIRQVTIQWDEQSGLDGEQTETNYFLESVMEKLEVVSEQQLRSLAYLRLPQIVKELVEISGISLQQLCEFIQLEGITSGEQLVGAIRTGHVMIIKQSQEQAFDLASFLLSELGELAVMAIIGKLQAKKQEGSQQQLLSEKELNILGEILKGRNLEQEIQSDPSVISRILCQYQMDLEVQKAQRQVLESSYEQIKVKISDYINSKQNYAQLVQKGFEFQDSVGSGVISYQSFCRVFQKLKLLNPPQITTLFRYCILLQRGISVEIVDRSQKIGYLRLLSDLLSTKTLIIDKQHQLLEQLRTQNNHLERRMVQADHLINSLAQEKEELLVLVMDCQQRVLVIEKQKNRAEAEGISLIQNLKRQFNNEQTVARVKAQSQIRKLNNIVENQNRVMECYRAELQNIMNQVQARHI